MKNLFFFFVFVQFSLLMVAQEKTLDSISTNQPQVLDSIFIVKDTTKYIKTIDYTTKRAFKDNLKEKYTESDFTYTEEEKKERSTPTDLSFLRAIGAFLQTIFPFLLGGFIVFLILKLVLGSELGFFNFKKGKKKVAEKLIYEEDDIHEIDLETLLQEAIATENYRLAIRYYYLIVLKELSAKKLIKYHKEKTNTVYKFELEKGQTRDNFAYLSYVYTYVWYGEFTINKDDFKKAASKFLSFKTLIK